MLQVSYQVERHAVLRNSIPHLGEILLIAAAYFAYMYSRKLVYSDFETQALVNAARIVDVERSLGFFWEAGWQEYAIDTARNAVVFFNWAYIVTFWPILLTAGVILYVVNRQRFRYYRNIVLFSFVFALLGFMLFPLAPPRMIGGLFVDTIRDFGPTFYASREFANFYNPYAAMPSLHFSWTLMFGIMFLRTPGKFFKVIGVVYPTMTLLAITITANHYILDAVGGAILVALAFGAVELGVRRRFFVPRVLGHLRSRRDRSTGVAPFSNRPYSQTPEGVSADVESEAGQDGLSALP